MKHGRRRGGHRQRHDLAVEAPLEFVGDLLLAESGHGLIAADFSDETRQKMAGVPFALGNPASAIADRRKMSAPGPWKFPVTSVDCRETSRSLQKNPPEAVAFGVEKPPSIRGVRIARLR